MLSLCIIMANTIPNDYRLGLSIWVLGRRFQRVNRAIWMLIGVIVSIVPSAWVGLFSGDGAVLRFGGLYLRIVGPFYGFIGAALLLFFASQGAGQMRWPFIGGLLRFLIVIVIGGAVVRVFGAGLPALFAVIALSAVTFGTVNALGIGSGAWRQLRTPSPVSLADG